MTDPDEPRPGGRRMSAVAACPECRQPLTGVRTMFARTADLHDDASMAYVFSGPRVTVYEPCGHWRGDE